MFGFNLGYKVDKKGLYVKVDKSLISVLDTVVYINMQEDDSITRDDIVERALAEYFSKRVAIIEDNRDDHNYGSIKVSSYRDKPVHPENVNTGYVRQKRTKL